MPKILATDENIKRFKSALSGDGNLKLNIYIKKMRETLINKYCYDKRLLLEDFMGWFFERGLDKKYDEKKAKLDYYLTQQAFYYLSEKIKKLKKDDDRKKQLREILRDTNPAARKYKFTDLNRLHGITEKQYKEAVSWMLPKNDENPEVMYMKKEMFDIIYSFFPAHGYNIIYLEVMLGHTTIVDAAAELGIHRNWVAQNLIKMGAELQQLLYQKGYSFEDVLETLDE